MRRCIWVVESFLIKGREPLTEKLPQSIESSRFVSHRGRMLGELDSRKDSQSAKFEGSPEIFLKLSFRELCDSKLSCLHPFDNMVTIHWVEICQKQRKSRLWVNETQILEVIFCYLHWQPLCRNKWHPGTSEISTVPEIAVGTQFLVQYGTKSSPVYLHADGEVSWSLLPISVFLLSGGIVQPENTYSRILKVTAQVWESQNRISITSNHSYHQSSSP